MEALAGAEEYQVLNIDGGDDDATAAPAVAPLPLPLPTPKPKRVVKKRSPAELQEFKLEVARKQNALRWGVDQLRATEADEQLVSGARPLQLMDLPNEVLALIFRPQPCPAMIDYKNNVKSSPSIVELHQQDGVCQCRAKWQQLCTSLSRRTYQLFRQGVTRCTIWVVRDMNVHMYNQLKLRAGRLEAWREQMHVWTPMPALRKVTYAVSNNVQMGDMKVLTRVAIPWYYLTIVTTLEQRRTMRLRLGDSTQMYRLAMINFEPRFLYLTLLEFGRIEIVDGRGLSILLNKLDQQMSGICHAYRKRGGITDGYRMMGFQWPQFDVQYGRHHMLAWHTHDRSIAVLCARNDIRIRFSDVESRDAPQDANAPVVEDAGGNPRLHQFRRKYRTYQFTAPAVRGGELPQALIVGEPEYGEWRYHY